MHDLLIYCPLREEFESLTQFFEYETDLTEEKEYILLSCNISGVKILLAKGDNQGGSLAVSRISDIYKSHPFRNVCCLGIAGQLDDEVLIGDVCFAGQIFDITQSLKVTDTEISINPYPYKTPSSIISAFNNFLDHPQNRPLKEELQQKFSERKEMLGIQPNPNVSSSLKIASGSIVTGPVGASDRLKKKILSGNRKHLALETEAGPIFEYFENNDSVNVFTIRGISDLADGSKNKGEKESGGSWRKFAAMNAASFLKFCLENSEGLRVTLTGQKKGIEPGELAKLSVETLLEDEYHGRLQNLSLEFKSKNKKYWVPAPRIAHEGSLTYSGKPKDIAGALEMRPAIVLPIPITYPDEGISYLYGIELLNQRISGTLALPIVIDIGSFAPPRSLDEYVWRNFDVDVKEQALSGVHKVVLIGDNAAVNSKTKMDHLRSELSRLDWGLLLIDRSNSGRLISETINDYGWSKWRISDISFSSITKFISTGFNMDHVAAESLALRLYNTFVEYDMIPHPAYFAGMSEELLERLISTNRRSEILELAALSFTSASSIRDANKVKISRSARHEILKEIVRVEMKQGSCGRDQIEGWIRSQMEHLGLDADARTIIDSFVQVGAVFADTHNVSIKLPFLKAYLISQILVEDSETATKYFVPFDPKLDYATFFVFCELGGASDFADRACESIEKSIDNFDEWLGSSGMRKLSGPHALLDPAIGPSVLRTPKAISKMSSGFIERAEKLLKSEGDIGSKEQVLDAEFHVAREVKLQEAKAKPDFSARTKIHGSLIFALAVLGGGAERLDLATKKRLTAGIVRLVELIADDWLRMVQTLEESIDPSDIIERVKSDDVISARFGRPEDIEQFVAYVIDALSAGEYLSILPSIFYPIKEFGGTNLLSRAIRELEIDSKSGRLFRNIWHVLTDAQEGEVQLEESFKELPKTSFIRYSIASLIYDVAYWNATSEDERESLLNAAKSSVRVLQLQLKDNS